ncbi:MAG: threonine/serine exporter family protein [Deltaproteobacteria bacterium]|nr:threonine/serine exporter family protein [Deltaproteobacteria bacterium]
MDSPVVSVRAKSLGGARDLDWEELTDVIDLLLWSGKLLLEHGASAPRVEATVYRLGTGLGVDDLDILVSPNVIVITTSEGHEFRTKARRIAHVGVNLSAIVAVSDLVRAVIAGRIGRSGVRRQLATIAAAAPAYPRWLVVLMVGVACGAFGRIFGADWAGFGATVVAAAAAMAVRQQLALRRFNPGLVVLATALAASGLCGLLLRLLPSAAPQHALAACVLLLVPGVPLINAVEELVRGHAIIALGRTAVAVLVTFAAALGLMLGMELTGLGGLL